MLRGVRSALLIGMRSCGQALTITKTSPSACRTTLLPGGAAEGASEMRPSADTGTAMNRFSGSGTCSGRNPCDVTAAA